MRRRSSSSRFLGHGGGGGGGGRGFGALSAAPLTDHGGLFRARGDEEGRQGGWKESNRQGAEFAHTGGRPV